MKNIKFQPFLIGYSVFATIGLAMMLMAFSNLHATYDEITVKRINIVDGKGHNRMVIADKEMMPPPIVNGKVYKRAVSPAGIIFYNETGSECGGIALSKNGKDHLQALAFDYSNFDAIGMLSQDSPNGNEFKAGVIINDKKVQHLEGNTRLMLVTENGNAGLFINDPQGKPRISINVDSLGTPQIKILNKDGKTLKELSLTN